MPDLLEKATAAYDIDRASILQVSELNEFIDIALSSDNTLQHVNVVGEATNVSLSSNDTLFFEVKDSTAQLSCVCFNPGTEQVTVPSDGDTVLVTGSVDLYQQRGTVSLKVAQIRPIGKGLYYQQLQKLKEDLADKGLFDEERKRPIPELPGIIGVVTSARGDAVKDIINGIREQNDVADIRIVHSSVQGDDAIPSLIKGVQYCDETADIDTIIVGRGGGSMEDLEAFNSKELALAIAEAQTPVVTGVGHRQDETIAGMVADVRGITPTDAGRKATADLASFQENVTKQHERLETAYEQFVSKKQQQTELERAQQRERLYKYAAIALLGLVLVAAVVFLWT